MKKVILLTGLFFCFFQIVTAQSGELDPSFGVKGIVKTNVGEDYNYGGEAIKVLTQSDGSIYIIFKWPSSSESTVISKRNQNSSPDSSFGSNGSTIPVQMNPIDAAVQADGKIVVIGSNTNDNFSIFRFNANGNPDSTFSDDGKQTTDFDNNRDYPSSVAVQQDGKILVTGESYNDSTQTSALAIVRYNSNGSIDNTFNKDGKLTEIMNATWMAVAVQSDGKILLAGSIISINDQNFLLERLNADGSTDSTFGSDGKQITDFGSLNFNRDDFASSIALQPDGKIVVGGSTSLHDDNDNNPDHNIALARYNTDGSLDNTFGSNGTQITDLGTYEDAAVSISVQQDGKIVLAGAGGGLARFNADGNLDNTFSGDGIASDFWFNSVAVQKDGKIVGAGFYYIEQPPYLQEFAVAKYNMDGSLDNSFNKNGKLIDGFKARFTQYSSTAIQKDGKIVAAGKTWIGSNFDFAIVRYNKDGSSDSAFGNHGKKTIHFIGDSRAASIAIQTDGKIVVGGYSLKNGGSDNDFTIVRLNTDGSLDSSFSNDGKQTTDFSAGDITDDYINSLAIQSDGKIIVSGSVQNPATNLTYLGLARYNTDGSLDTKFDHDGKLTSYPTTFNSNPLYSIAIQEDGKIVVASSEAILRFNKNGSSDATFSHDGKQTTDIGVLSLALQNDGKIVVAGFASDNINGFGIARYNTNGSLDSTFSGDGKLNTSFNSEYAYATSVAIQNDGKIVAGGVSGSNNFLTGQDFALARYTADGSLDSTFSGDGKQITVISEDRDYLSDIAIANNKLYTAGFSEGSGNLGVIVSYLLDNNSNVPPTVSLTAPANNAKYLAPAAHIKLNASAADADGTITKVEFYSDTALLHTETIFPYGFVWRNVQMGNYTLTAKATDNSGNVTTSAAVHILVVPNKPPVVSIIKPASNQSFTAPADIHLEAAVSDTDGRISRVELYNGSVLIRTEYKYPYTYDWNNIPAGTYTVTAVATDNWGAQTTSAPITATVTSDSTIVSNKASSQNKKASLNDALSLKVSPNPASNIVNIYTRGLQQNKRATLSIISVSGIILKTMRIDNSSTHLDASSLTSGVYTIKVVSEQRVLYKQFVKL